MYRAERLDGKGMVEGYMTRYDGAYYVGKDGQKLMIVYSTLEIYLFGEWRLVSELEKKYKLVEV